MFYDGEAQSGSPLFPRTAFIDAEKALENARNVLFRNTYPVVGHFDHYPVEHVDETDRGATSFAAVFDRIGQQVGYDLTDSSPVGENIYGRLGYARADFDGDAVCSGLHFYGIGDFVHQGDDIETFLVEDQHARFEFRYLFQVLHDIDQPVYAFFGAFQVFAVDVFVLQSAVEQGQDCLLYTSDAADD